MSYFTHFQWLFVSMSDYLGELPGLVWCPQTRRYFSALAPARTPVVDQPQRAEEQRTQEEVGDMPLDPRVWTCLEQSSRTSSRGGQCSVCLRSARGKVVELMCQHSFHVNCLRDWVNRKGSCPTCRAPVDQALAAAHLEAVKTTL